MSGPFRPRGALRYPDYLGLPGLLDLQRPVSSPPHHDEMLFIVVHQVFELWFKLMLHEVDELVRRLAAADPRQALKHARRLATIQRALIDQVDVLETMSALDFLEFRSDLEGASGFQSAQFRELETVLGIRDRERVPLPVPGGKAGLDAYLAMLAPEERLRIERRLDEPSLEDSFLDRVARVVPGRMDRVYLADLADLPELAAQAPALVAGLHPGAVIEESETGPLRERLEALPLWSGLVAPARARAAAALARGRLAEELKALGGVALEGPEAFEVKLLDEEAERRLTVAAADVERALGAGAPWTALRDRLERRRKLRQVYHRAAHRPGPGDTYDLWVLAEALLDFAQSYQTFRFRHVKMVERMIGKRRGTGGSPGVAYLEQTLRYQALPELWRVRTYL